MKFFEIINKYYNEAKQERLINLLNELLVLKNVECTINDFFEEIENKNKIEITSILTITIRDFVISINKSKSNIKSNFIEKEEELIQLGVYLIKETFEASKFTAFEYFSVLKQTTKIVYKNYNWDFKMLNDLMKFDNLQYFSQTKSKEIKTPKPIHLILNPKLNIDFFISDIIEEFKGIKNKKSLYKLFDAIDDDFKIVLKSEHLELFLSLFYLLNQCNTISTKGNRGIFKYLEKHIIPPNNENFKKLEFRKIRYNAFIKKDNKNKIINKLKPLIDKYCDNGQ